MRRFVSLLLSSSLLSASLVAQAQQPVQPVPIYINGEQGQPAPAAPNSARAPNGEYVAPMQQQTQTTYVPQSVALSGPHMIKDWEPGRPIPPGYHPETRVRTGLIIGGAITFGVLYLLSALVAAAGQDASRNGDNPVGALYVPVFGPFIQMGQKSSATGNVVLIVDGLGQAAGAAMLVIGLASPRDVLVRNDLGKVRVTPVALGNQTMGMGLTGSF